MLSSADTNEWQIVTHKDEIYDPERKRWGSETNESFTWVTVAGSASCVIVPELPSWLCCGELSIASGVCFCLQLE